MVKSYEKDQKTEKNPDNEKNPLKGNHPCTDDHTDKYQKKHEKGSYPRRVWPTDSENSKHKGPKI